MAAIVQNFDERNNNEEIRILTVDDLDYLCIHRDVKF